MAKEESSSKVDYEETASRPRRLPKEAQTLDAQHDRLGVESPKPAEAKDSERAERKPQADETSDK